MIIKVKILIKCSYCDGKAYLPAGETVDTKGERYMRYFPCPKCHGSGLSGKWINLTVFQQLLEQAECPHEHVSHNGRHHFSAGEVWDCDQPWYNGNQTTLRILMLQKFFIQMPNNKNYKGKKKRPKKKTLPKVSLGAIVSENLPNPIVYYPQHYGTFFCFSVEKYDYDSLVMCACSNLPIKNFFRLNNSDNSQFNYRLELKNYFPAIIVDKLFKWDGKLPLPVKVQEGICHKCNNVTPSLRYCHEMYGTRFLQYFGWYVNQTHLRLGIKGNKYLSDVCPKEFQEDVDEIKILEEFLPNNSQALRNYLSENIDFDESNSRTLFWKNLQRENPEFYKNIQGVVSKRQKVLSNKIENVTRAELGFKNIGEGWVSETVLFQIVKQIFQHHEVIFHSKPAWLNGLEIDIFVPEQKIGFEYQGEQHYHPIDAWGGKEALEELQDRDLRKIDLCRKNGVRLIIIDYSETLSEEYIRKIINYQ